jgi:hypothetical protein
MIVGVGMVVVVVANIPEEDTLDMNNNFDYNLDKLEAVDNKCQSLLRHYP